MTTKTIQATGLALLAAAAICAAEDVQAQETPAESSLPEAGPGVVQPDALSEEAFEDAGEEAEVGFPRVVWGVAAEIEDDWTFSATDEDAELNNLYPTVEAELAFEFAEGSGLYSTLVFEPVRDPTGDSAFQDLGLYVEELYAAVTVAGGWVGLAGKYNPAFGLAWDVAPGLYGADFAEDYELTEGLGAAVSIPFTAFGGEQRLNFSGFTADASVLSDSLFTSRGNVSRADGGPANTNTPSLAAALTGPLTDELEYDLGLRWLQAGEGDPADEHGAVAGLVWSPEIARGEAQFLGEAAYFQNYDSTEDSAVYFTAGAAWSIDRWTVSGVYSLRDMEAADTDHLATASLEYEVLDNAVAAVGYRFGREGGENSHTVGVLFAVEFGGAFGVPTN